MAALEAPCAFSTAVQQAIAFGRAGEQENAYAALGAYHRSSLAAEWERIRARELALPGPEDERRRAVGSHRAVEDLQLHLCRRRQRMRRRRLLQPGQQRLRGQRLFVGLHRRQVVDRMLAPRTQQLLDALLPSLHHGVAVVAFEECSGVNRLVEPGRSGVLVETGADPVPALAAGLRTLIDRPPDDADQAATDLELRQQDLRHFGHRAAEHDDIERPVTLDALGGIELQHLDIVLAQRRTLKLCSARSLALL